MPLGSTCQRAAWKNWWQGPVVELETVVEEWQQWQWGRAAEMEEVAVVVAVAVVVEPVGGTVLWAIR